MELDGDFDLAQFAHRACYNASAGRIETHIVSLVEQSVRVGDKRYVFSNGEAMLVEYSCKYSQEDFAVMAAKAGLRVVHTWMDPQRWFAVQMLERI